MILEGFHKTVSLLFFISYARVFISVSRETSYRGLFFFSRLFVRLGDISQLVA